VFGVRAESTTIAQARRARIILDFKTQRRLERQLWGVVVKSRNAHFWPLEDYSQTETLPNFARYRACAGGNLYCRSASKPLVSAVAS
jgi:hypothetical protein